jgi:hypothetical protein
MVCTIQRIWEQQLAAATNLVFAVDCATEVCLQEDQQTRRSKKVKSTRSAFSINFTPGKINIGKPNKIKR